MAKKNKAKAKLKSKKPTRPAKKVKARAKARPKAKATRAVKKPAAVKAGPRQSWLDAASNKPIIDRYARQLGSFMEAMADGRIEESELKAQEGRLVKLMKEVEPQLDGALHEKVTQMLCELTAYDIMHMLYAMTEGRPKTVFQG